MEQNDESSIFIEGRKIISDFQNALVNIFVFGLLNVICRLSPELEILLKTTPCSFDQANCVVLKDQYRNKKIVKIHTIKVKQTRTLQRYTKNGHVRILNTQFGRFIYDYSIDKFILPKFRWEKKTFEEVYERAMNRNTMTEIIECYDRKIIYGLNRIELDIRSNFEILLDNIIEPFFIWEIFSFVTWIAIKYYKYALVVGSIYLVMLLVNIRDDLRKNRILKQSIVISNVRVLRDGSFKFIPEYDVLPGDLIYIDNTDNFTCDAEILKGSVITDESFLTGESVPICKGPGSIVYSGTKVIKSICTSVSLNNQNIKNLVKAKCVRRKNDPLTIEITDSEKEVVEDSAIGVVIKTGKRTRRSNLLANLSNKKPIANEFVKQSSVIVKYLISGAVILMIAFIGYFIDTLPFTVNLEYSSDIALTFFSPALYTCLQLGIQHARRELLSKEIITTEVSRINTAGEVDMVIFDKTGTLTELGVDILCFDTIENSFENIDDININIRMALSTCHYVVELDDQYSGDVIDMKMFLFSQSKIINKENKRFIEMEVKRNYKPICKEYADKEEDNLLYLSSEGSNGISEERNIVNDDYSLFLESNTIEMSNEEPSPEDTLEVLKIYDFDMYLKRLSVVVRDYSGKTYLFCKGAPDSVKQILSSIPDSYIEKVRDYGLEGYRVLTVAMKEINEYGDRIKDESDLEFLGFLVLANKLKEETCDVIRDLREANLNPKMCTGDGILTAICVAKECGMIDPTMPVLFPVLEDGCKSCYDVEWYSPLDEHFFFDKYRMLLHTESDNETELDFVIACEGKEFEYFKLSQYHQFILEKGVVFARFNPDNKKELIECYSKAGYVTMFCGDGANDTGALCSADVGLSLAINEASLAASFNSKHLKSVLDVIKEGRSALSMSASQFKYIFYSQILAGFQMVALFPHRLFPSDGMSLINDLMSCYVLGYSLSTFKASQTISPKKYIANIYKDAFRILQELILILVIYFLSGLYIHDEEVTEGINSESKKSTLVFLTTMILLITKAIQFGDFGKYRTERLQTPKFLFCVGCCLLLFLFVLVSFLVNFQPICQFFLLMRFESHERHILFFCISSSLLISYLPFREIVFKFFDP